MTDKIENQKKLLQYIINSIYDPTIKKQELVKDKIGEDLYNSYKKLLSKLPPNISPYFAEYATILLNMEPTTEHYYYRVIWLGILLKHIFLGQHVDVILAGSWEDDCALYEGCDKMLNDLNGSSV